MLPGACSSPGQCQGHRRRAGCCWLPHSGQCQGELHGIGQLFLGWLGERRGHSVAQGQPSPGHNLFYSAAQPSMYPNTHPWGGLSCWTWPWVNLSQRPGQSSSSRCPCSKGQSPAALQREGHRVKGSCGGKSADRTPCAGAVLAEAGSIGNNCFRVSFREHWSWQVGHREPEPGTCWG